MFCNTFFNSILACYLIQFAQAQKQQTNKKYDDRYALGATTIRKIIYGSF